MMNFRTFVCVAVVMLFSICKAEITYSENIEKYFFDIKFTIPFENNNYQDSFQAERSDLVDFFLKNGINKNDIFFNNATVLQNQENSGMIKIVEMVRVESVDLESLKLSRDKFKSFAAYDATEISDIKSKRKAEI